MHSTMTRRLCTTASSVLVLTACQDASAPPATVARFDSPRVTAGMRVVQTLASASGVNALQQVARLGGTATASTIATTQGITTASASIVHAALDAQVFAITVLAPSVLGKTLTYDTTSHRYKPSDRSGAPPNGVRVILYAETADHLPVISQELGFAELTNESPLSVTSAAIRLAVVTGGVTRLSYGVSFTLPGVTPELNIQGFLADATNRLEFTIAASASNPGSGSGIVNATLRVPSAGVEVLATIHAALAGSGSIDLVVSSGTDRITVTSAMNADQVDASFTVNGALFARATGSASAPTVVSADGRALSTDEREALGRIVTTAGGIVQLLNDLAAPAASIVQTAASIGR